MNSLTIKVPFTVALVFFAVIAKAQFWFGPIVGGHLSYYDFLDPKREDYVDVAAQVSYHAGLAMDYSTESAFEVHGELRYTNIRINTNGFADVFGIDPDTGAPTEETVSVNVARSEMVNHMLTMPIMARLILFQRSKIKFLGEVGPQLSYWLASTGTLRADGLVESGQEKIDQKVKFGTFDEVQESVEDNTSFVVSKPNRLQYGLGVGFGALWDITPERRVIVDAKYFIGHSIMAFNDGNGGVMAPADPDDLTIPNELGYVEDTEYQTNVFSISVAYMFGWNPVLNRKGRSTSSVGRKKGRKK
ncbi:outer membrane beta-barrel protein [Reichenbachiella versicolor]|uniref:outer membrane beta-barrel protein n=1 Tax=Reichenbachiella versicolor TaxID=1821036 RepID=UPI000D6E886E|nr:outer membrane beta-barrel protein [Reichenbachiella versicolor]